MDRLRLLSEGRRQYGGGMTGLPSEEAIRVVFKRRYRGAGDPTDAMDGPELCAIYEDLRAAYAVDFPVSRDERLRAALKPLADMYRDGDGEDDLEIVLQRGVASDMTVLTNHDIWLAHFALATASLGENQ
jgi:hypothetical protein